MKYDMFAATGKLIFEEDLGMKSTRIIGRRLLFPLTSVVPLKCPPADDVFHTSLYPSRVKRQRRPGSFSRVAPTSRTDPARRWR
jgi:hypothetical protein